MTLAQGAQESRTNQFMSPPSRTNFGNFNPQRNTNYQNLMQPQRADFKLKTGSKSLKPSID